MNMFLLFYCRTHNVFTQLNDHRTRNKENCFFLFHKKMSSTTRLKKKKESIPRTIFYIRIFSFRNLTLPNFRKYLNGNDKKKKIKKQKLCINILIQKYLFAEKRDIQHLSVCFVNSTLLNQIYINC